MSSYVKTTGQGGLVYADDQGMPYITGAGKAGTSAQYLLKTASGSSEAIVFETEGLMNMADASYVVIVQAEASGSETGAVVDESTKTTTGFTVLQTAASEVLNIVVFGRLAGQAA